MGLQQQRHKINQICTTRHMWDIKCRLTMGRTIRGKNFMLLVGSKNMSCWWDVSKPYRSASVPFIKSGRRDIPSMTRSSGGLIPARSRAVVNQSIIDPSWWLTLPGTIVPTWTRYNTMLHFNTLTPASWSWAASVAQLVGHLSRTEQNCLRP